MGEAGGVGVAPRPHGLLQTRAAARHQEAQAQHCGQATEAEQPLQLPWPVSAALSRGRRRTQAWPASSGCLTPPAGHAAASPHSGR